MNHRELVAESLALTVKRVDPVLNPWGFSFSLEGVHGSHNGPFASGHYIRGRTRIGLSCREMLDNLYYEHSFVTQNVCSRETETFDIGHDTLMRGLGHSDDCWLIVTDKQPDAVVARDGGDRVAALLHDLTTIAAAVLREPNETFYAIMRRGRRCYSIE